MSRVLTAVAVVGGFALVGTLGAWEHGTISTSQFVAQFALSVAATAIFGMAARKEGGNGKEL